MLKLQKELVNIEKVSLVFSMEYFQFLLTINLEQYRVEFSEKSKNGDEREKHANGY